MNLNQQEIEAKFFIQHPDRFEEGLKASGARCTQERVLEINLRFDNPEHELSQRQQVLRLRMDRRARLTYKGPSDPTQSLAVRQEIEFEVSDFEAARDFLEALGYVVIVLYEKYRASYMLGDVEISLDEMPYGTFAEIEGPGSEQIQAAAELLGLDWEARCKESYLSLFERLKHNLGLTARHLTFAELAGRTFKAGDFNLMPAN